MENCGWWRLHAERPSGIDKISEFRNLYPLKREWQALERLSGGEQADARLGGALSKPKCLMLDETTSIGIASAVGQKIFETIVRSTQQSGLSIVSSTEMPPGLEVSHVRHVLEYRQDHSRGSPRPAANRKCARLSWVVIANEKGGLRRLSRANNSVQILTAL